MPTGDLEGSDYHFAGGRRIGGQDIDYTFTDLARDDAGLAWVRLTASDETSAALWVDDGYPFIEIYTPTPNSSRTGAAASAWDR